MPHVSLKIVHSLIPGENLIFWWQRMTKFMWTISTFMDRSSNTIMQGVVVNNMCRSGSTNNAFWMGWRSHIPDSWIIFSRITHLIPSNFSFTDVHLALRAQGEHLFSFWKRNILQFASINFLDYFYQTVFLPNHIECQTIDFFRNSSYLLYTSFQAKRVSKEV